MSSGYCYKIQLESNGTFYVLANSIKEALVKAENHIKDTMLDNEVITTISRNNDVLIIY